MKRRMCFTLICLLTSVILAACIPSQAEREEQATKIANSIFATLTAESQAIIPTLTPIQSTAPPATSTRVASADQARVFADPILAAIANRSPTYEDNFDDPESGWKTGPSGSGEVGYVPAVGEYFAAVPAANGGDHVCADADDGRIPVPYAADFVMEYRFRFAVVAEGGKLIVHFRTIGGVYSIWVDVSADPDAHITLLDTLTQDVPGPKFGSYRLGGGIMSAEWFTVRIVARDAAIVVYVDDRPAIFAEIPNYDPAMHGSEIGFNFCNFGQSPIEGRWDYLRLWDISDLP